MNVSLDRGAIPERSKKPFNDRFSEALARSVAVGTMIEAEKATNLQQTTHPRKHRGRLGTRTRLYPERRALWNCISAWSEDCNHAVT